MPGKLREERLLGLASAVYRAAGPFLVPGGRRVEKLMASQNPQCRPEGKRQPRPVTKTRAVNSARKAAKVIASCQTPLRSAEDFVDPLRPPASLCQRALQRYEHPEICHIPTMLWNLVSIAVRLHDMNPASGGVDHRG